MMAKANMAIKLGGQNWMLNYSSLTMGQRKTQTDRGGQMDKGGMKGQWGTEGKH